MKHILTVWVLFLALGTTAQEISVDLDNFTEIKVYNGLHVKLLRANENKAVVTGSSREKVKINVEEGVLNIRTSITYLLKDDNTLVTVHYKELENLEAGQNSRIEIREKINGNYLRLRAKEGSHISATMDVKSFEGSAVTGGFLDVAGNAEKQKIDVKAGGEFKGENLKGREIEVKVNGGGNANVLAREYVNATVRAGGHIYVYGNPDQLDQQVSFGGTIKKIN